MRIVGGKHKGRTIEVPMRSQLRPTSERMREALFNRLVHGGHGAGGGSILVDAIVMDAFCGTGALGLEALSRGATRAYFLDKDPIALDCARRNARTYGEFEHCRFLLTDATKATKAPEPCKVVFMDPPYADDLTEEALNRIAEGGWIEPGGIVSVEIEAHGNAYAPPLGFALIDARIYGRGLSLLLRYTPQGWRPKNPVEES